MRLINYAGLLFCFGLTAQADNIVTIRAIDALQSVNGIYTSAEEWSSTIAYKHVSAFLDVGTLDPNATSATAWLMNAVGPGANSANVIASATFDVPLVPNSDFIPATQVFDAFLPAGTYYVVINSPSNSVVWEIGSDSFVGQGVTLVGSIAALTAFNSTFPPASQFRKSSRSFAMTVEGTPTLGAAIPEPRLILPVFLSVFLLYVWTGRAIGKDARCSSGEASD